MKGIEFTGCRGSMLVVLVNSVVVKMSGAVSPAARAIRERRPGEDPAERRRQITTCSTVRHLRHPSAWLASRSDCGTSVRTSCVDREMSGSMMIASAIDAMNALCLYRSTSRP